MATCYRHPNRETGVSCSNCDRPICPDCMTPTSVGMRCPECARQKQKVVTARTLQTSSEPRVTMALIAINVIVFLGSGQFGFGGGGGSRLYSDLGLFGPSIHYDHEYWRLVGSGFLHAGFLHIALNMYLLYVLGRMLEPMIGSVRFGFVYFASLLSGSFGALLLSKPNSFTVGASGAVFGLMGATFVLERARGIDPMQSGIGGLILINLAFSFILSGISIGGHIGGLVGGGLAALAIQQSERHRLPRFVPLVACVLIAAVSVVGAIMVANAKT